MTTPDTTYELFMRSVLDDEDRGYPSHVSFIPSDQDWTDDALWHNIRDGVPSVVVVGDFEFLVTPRAHPFWVSLYFQLRRQIPVTIQWRSRDTPPLAFESHVGRHALTHMRELALV